MDDNEVAPAQGSDSTRNPIVVAIGASAGGIQALQNFFDHVPARSGAAFVVVVHLDPRHRSELPQILSARTRMPVVTVQSRRELKADHVYVIAPDRRLQLVDHEIMAAPFDEPRGQRSPIDQFFCSMAEHLGDGFAVILSGAGSDGAIGVKAAKEVGGMVLVQDPNESEDSSMPRAAIATGVADFVLPVKELVTRLAELILLKRPRAGSKRGQAVAATQALRAANEDLQTVNSELTFKLEAISRAHSDLQNLMAATDFGTLFLDLDFRIKRFTEHVTELFSITPEDEGRLISDFARRLPYDRLIEDARSVLSDLTPIRREVQSRNGRWFDLRMRPYRTVDNKVDGVVITFVDITERHEVDAAFLANEQELLQQKRLVELSRAPIFVWDFDGAIIEWNRGSEELYGFTRAEAVGKKKAALLELEPVAFERMKAELLQNGSWSGERQHKTKAGRELLVEARLQLENFGGRRLVLESALDVSERKAWEVRQRLLLRELGHRVKNALTVVQAIAHQTMRTTASPHEFVERFDGRLAALASTHNWLTQLDWKGADLGSLVRDQLSPYIGEGSQRLHLEGDAVILPPDIAMPFGLVLHELATNAAKYGALSQRTGKIDLKWRVNSGSDRPVLAFLWQEREGPRVRAPVKSGLGTKLIEGAIPNAKVEREFLSNGFFCRLTVPLEEAANGQDDGATPI